jgi:hypothetical protein
MFHGGRLRGVSVIFGYFIGNGQNPGQIVAPWSSAAPARVLLRRTQDQC